MSNQQSKNNYGMAYQNLCKMLHSLKCIAELLERQDYHFEYSQSGRLGLACLLRLSAKMGEEAIQALPMPSQTGREARQ